MAVRYLAGGPSRLRLFDLDGRARGEADAAAGGVSGRNGSGGRRPRLQRRNLSDAARVSSPDTGRSRRADQPARHQPGQLRRYGGDARHGALAGWHRHSDEHHPAEGHRARRQPSDAAVRIRRLRHQPDAVFSRRDRVVFSSTPAASTRSPTCAAAASSARSGTRKGSLTRKQNVFDDFAAAAQMADRSALHQPAEAGDPGRLERRAADGRRC